MQLGEILVLDSPGEPFDDPHLSVIAERIVRARKSNAP